MADANNRISLKIDLFGGTIELDAPADQFSQAIEKTKELAGGLEFRRANAAQTAPPIATAAPPAGQDAIPQERQGAPSLSQPPVRVTRTRAGKGPSSGRVGRIGSFEEVKGLLQEPQEIQLREFMAAKSPVEQVDVVLVAMVKGEELLSRRGFSYNEIYTLMWLAGVKDLPKALDVVLGRMIQEQLVIKENGAFAVKFVGRNRVDRELPKAT